MLVQKNPELKETIYSSIRSAVAKEREGIHLSDLIYCSRKAYFRKMGLSPKPTNEQCVLWMTGYAFQAFMFPLDEEVPVIIDGIHCTPDIPRGIEVKSTRQSSRRFEFESMRHWQRQILGYCKALNKLEYDLVVMFVCGNYAPPFPDIDCWHIEATQEEVETNWTEVLQRAVKLQIAIESNFPPEPDCEPWEGGYCECVDLCPDTACFRKRQLKEDKK